MGTKQQACRNQESYIFICSGERRRGTRVSIEASRQRTRDAQRADYTGNISYTTDSQGNVKTRMIYKPYGETIIEGDDNFRSKFNTHEQDKTGLQYFNARYYDPEVGRFAQADPTVPDPLNSQAFNRYMFCLGNPISLMDASGFAGDKGGTQGTVENVGPDGQKAYTPDGTGGAPTATVTWSDPGESKGAIGKGAKGGSEETPQESVSGTPASPSMYGPGHSDSAPRYMAYGFGINSPSMAFSNLSAGAGIQSVHISNMNNSTDFASGSFFDNKFSRRSCGLGATTGGMYFFIALSKNLNVNDHANAIDALETWTGDAFSFSKGNIGNGNKGAVGKVSKSLSPISFINSENWSGIAFEFGGKGSISGMVTSNVSKIRINLPLLLSKTNNQIGKTVIHNANEAKLSRHAFGEDANNLMNLSDQSKMSFIKSLYH